MGMVVTKLLLPALLVAKVACAFQPYYFPYQFPVYPGQSQVQSQSQSGQGQSQSQQQAGTGGGGAQSQVQSQGGNGLNSTHQTQSQQQGSPITPYYPHFSWWQLPKLGKPITIKTGVQRTLSLGSITKIMKIVGSLTQVIKAAFPLIKAAIPLISQVWDLIQHFALTGPK